LRDIGALLLVLLGLGVGAPSLQGQEVAPPLLDRLEGVRIVALESTPEEPRIGEPIFLRIHLRRPGSSPPTPREELLSAEALDALSPARWIAQPAPGDSTDLFGEVTLLSYRVGRLDLPALLLEEEGGLVALRLGGLVVSPLEGALVLQPAAGVLGGEQGLWRGVAWGSGGALLLLLFLLLWPAGRSPAQMAGHQPPPEVELQSSLERARTAPLLEAYAMVTGAIRHFAARQDPRLGPAVTVHELLPTLLERWPVPEEGGGPAPVLLTGERVRFGGGAASMTEFEREWGEAVVWARSLRESDP